MSTTVFIVEREHPVSGYRERLPYQFTRGEEADALARELALSNPLHAYAVRSVPAPLP